MNKSGEKFSLKNLFIFLLFGEQTRRYDIFHVFISIESFENTIFIIIELWTWAWKENRKKKTLKWNRNIKINKNERERGGENVKKELRKDHFSISSVPAEFWNSLSHSNSILCFSYGKIMMARRHSNESESHLNERQINVWKMTVFLITQLFNIFFVFFVPIFWSHQHWRKWKIFELSSYTKTTKTTLNVSSV